MAGRPMEHEIEAAVKWWCDQLRGHPTKDARNYEIASDIDAGAGTWIGRAIAADNARSGLSRVDDATVERFGVALRRMIEERVAAFPPDRFPDPYYSTRARIMLEVDYEPYWLLADAWAEAGGDRSLSMFVFPNKTTMHLNPGKVTVGGTVVYER